MVNEKNARRFISLLAVASLLALALFLGDARLHAAMAGQPSQEEILAPTVEQLNRQIEQSLRIAEENQELREELEALRQGLAEAQAEVERIQRENISLADDVVMQYAGVFKTTAYCCEEYKHICGGNGVTASDTKPTPGLTCAADWSLFEPGTWLYIEDVGIRRVEDSGSAIKGEKLDVAVDTHENALRWVGYGKHKVWVLTFGEI